MSNPNVNISNIGLATVAKTGSYNDLTNAPNVAAASAVDVPFSPTGTISSTNVQAALAETASEAIQTSTKGVANGVASLDNSGQVPLSQLGNAPVGGGSSAVANPTPPMHGFLSWTIDPVQVGQVLGPTTGTVYLFKMAWPTTATITNIETIVYTGTSLTNCYVGIYNSSGTLLGQSADQSTSWNSAGGDRVIALTSPISVTGSSSTYIYAAFLVGGGTPGNLMLRTLTNAIIATNMGLTAANGRAMTSGSGLTALPSSITLSGTTQQQYVVPIGVK